MYLSIWCCEFFDHSVDDRGCVHIIRSKLFIPVNKTVHNQILNKWNIKREREREKKGAKMMSLNVRKIAVFLVIVMIVSAVCDAKRKKSKKITTKPEIKQAKYDNNAKQVAVPEMTGTNFVVLLIMRLVYGIAVQMNMEDRIAGWFNGAFVPPNADDDYGFGDFGGLDDLGDGAGIGDGIDGLFK